MASFNLKRFIKNPKKGLENAFRSVGKVNKDIAPYVGMIPGVGPALGAATGAWGSVLSGGNMKSHLTTAIKGGLSGYANQQAGGQGFRRLLPSGGGGNIRVPKELDMSKVFLGLPGMPAPNTTFPQQGGGGGWQDTLGRVVRGVAGAAGGQQGNQQGGNGFDWKDPGDWMSAIRGNAVDIGIGGLAGYQALNAAKASKRAGQLQDKAIGGAEKRWADNEALRTEGRRRLLNPTRPDLSSVYADPTNPLAKRPTPVTTPLAPPGIMGGPGGLMGKLKRARDYSAANPGTLGPGGIQYAPSTGGGLIANKIANARKRLLPAPY